MIVFKSRIDVLVRTRDGRNVVIEEPIDLVDDAGDHYRVPAGAQSDGCSIPRAGWSFNLAPFGTYWLGSVVHDAGYRGTLLKQNPDGTWSPADLTQDQCDLLFLDCMRALGVDPEVAKVIYEGVHLGGWKAFRDDRAA